MRPLLPPALTAEDRARVQRDATGDLVKVAADFVIREVLATGRVSTRRLSINIHAF